MYFIYFTVFVLMVFVPVIVSPGATLMFLNEEVLEVLIILFLGTIGFAIYLWQEKKFKINFKKRIAVQKESHQIFKDLSEAYSYIGEVNRKLEIMKGLARGISENYDKRSAVAYSSFFEAFTLIRRSKKVSIQFIDKRHGKLLEEAKSIKKINFDLGISISELLKKPENFFETEEYFVAKTAKDIRGIIAVVLVGRDLVSHRIEDPELMKAIASQALQLFILSSKGEY